MHFSTIIFSFLPIAAVSNAACHNSGATWGGNIPQVQNILRNEVCRSDRLAGSFSAGQKKTRCVQIGNGLHVDFEVKRVAKSAATLTNGDCYFYLNTEVEGCSKGGRRTYDNWEFSADPNSGPC
ncbi:hypothetical protein FALCPG4_018422 [Fusarium falciforme]